MAKQKNGLLPERGENEQLAISFVRELIDKYEIFDECVFNKALDDAGIDMLLIKRVGKRGKHFRLHIQHKSSLSSSNVFRRLNPCIPSWIVNKKTTPLEAFTSLLSIAVKKASEQESPHSKFFLGKFEEIKKLYGSTFKF